MKNWNDEENTAEIQTLSLGEMEKALLHDFSDTGELAASYIAARNGDKGKRREMTDTNSYFTVIFKTNKQLRDFCEHFGLESDFIYLEGKEFVRQMKKAVVVT